MCWSKLCCICCEWFTPPPRNSRWSYSLYVPWLRNLERTKHIWNLSVGGYKQIFQINIAGGSTDPTVARQSFCLVSPPSCHLQCLWHFLSDILLGVQTWHHVRKLATRLHHCFTTLPWLAQLALSVSIDLVFWSARVTSVKSQKKGVSLIDIWTPA